MVDIFPLLEKTRLRKTLTEQNPFLGQIRGGKSTIMRSLEIRELNKIKQAVFTWNAHPPKASSFLLATDASVFPALLVSRHNKNRRMPCEWGSDICRKEVSKNDVL